MELALASHSLDTAKKGLSLGLFFHFLSVKILKGWHIYFDFQKVERKKWKQALFYRHLNFLEGQI